MAIVDGKTLIGWGTVREKPWHFVALFASQEEAQARANEMGPGYIACYGERHDDPDTFTCADVTHPADHIAPMIEPLPTADDTSGRLAAVAAWIDDHLQKTRSER